jgi:hypothetical protein
MVSYIKPKLLRGYTKRLPKNKCPMYLMNAPGLDESVFARYFWDILKIGIP